MLLRSAVMSPTSHARRSSKPERNGGQPDDCRRRIPGCESRGSSTAIGTNPNFQNIKKNKIVTEIIKQNELDKLCDTKTPQGIAGVFYYKNNFSSPDPANSGPVIAALENITDPGNMGVILRNCDWFGINKIIVSRDCVEILNPKVIRSSAGSVFHLDIFESDNFYSLKFFFKIFNSILSI